MANWSKWPKWPTYLLDKQADYEQMIKAVQDMDIPVDELESKPHQAKAIYEAAHGDKHEDVRHDKHGDGNTHGDDVVRLRARNLVRLKRLQQNIYGNLAKSESP
jgi:hypothetical protein